MARVINTQIHHGTSLHMAPGLSKSPTHPSHWNPWASAKQLALPERMENIGHPREPLTYLLFVYFVYGFVLAKTSPWLTGHLMWFTQWLRFYTSERNSHPQWWLKHFWVRRMGWGTLDLNDTPNSKEHHANHMSEALKQRSLQTSE